MIPYTYRLTHIPTNRHYYGVRFAKNCKPADLWNTYFSSSKQVHRLIKEDGKNAFRIEIRRTFKTREEAQDWEQRVLSRLKVTRNLNWLNISAGKARCTALCGPKNPNYGKPKPKEWKEHMSKMMSGENNPWFGKHHSEEAKKKISVAGMGRKLSEHTKQKLSDAKKGKPWTGGRCTPESRKRAALTMTGQRRTVEQRKRMSLAKLGKKYSLNRIPPNKNKHWYTNGSENKLLILPPIDAGWYEGRVMRRGKV